MVASSTVKRLWKEVLTRHRSKVLGGLALSAGTAAVTTLQPLVIRAFVNTIARSSSALHLVAWGLLLVLVPVARSALATGSNYVLAGTGQLVTLDFRRQIFQAVLRSPTHFADKTPAGQLIQLNTVEAGRVGEVYISQQVVPAVSAAIVITLTSVAMVDLDPMLAGIVLVFVVLGVVASGRRSPSLRKLEALYLGLRQQGSHILTEVFGNLRTVRLFGGENGEIRQWNEWMSQDRQLWLRQMMLRNWAAQGSSSLSQALSISLVLLVGMVQFRHHATSLGTIVAYVAFVPIVFAAVTAVERAQLGTAQITGVLDTVYGLIDSEPEQGVAHGTAHIDQLVFDSVTFRYPGRDYGLQEVNLRLNKGQTAVVLGMSGTGKSMLADLITGLYRPQVGQVLLGRLATDSWDLRTLRQRIGIVPQETALWTGTLRYNLLYGMDDEHISDRDIEQALRDAELSAMLDKLPKGLDTDIGPRGIQLSGGERQRLALARVFLRDPSVLIFDEPTSALDPILTDSIIRQIRAHKADAIKLLITHRPDVLRSSDTVIVVHEDGHVQSGAPSQMERTSGIYRELLQASERMGR